LEDPTSYTNGRVAAVAAKLQICFETLDADARHRSFGGISDDDLRFLRRNVTEREPTRTIS